MRGRVGAMPDAALERVRPGLGWTVRAESAVRRGRVGGARTQNERYIVREPCMLGRRTVRMRRFGLVPPLAPLPLERPRVGFWFLGRMRTVG